MAAGGTCAADAVDTVHHEMDSAVRIVTIFINMHVQSPVTGNKFMLEKELYSWTIHTMNLQDVAVINNSQIVGHTPSKVYSLQIMWYYITQRYSVIRCQASIILLGEGGKEKAQYAHLDMIIIVDPQKTWR